MSEKSEQKGRRGWVVPFFALLLLAGAYIGGYFALSNLITPYKDNGTERIARSFRSRLTAEAYVPLLLIERTIRARDMELMWTDESGHGFSRIYEY